MNRVVLVGAGCGEGMITLKGEALVRRADCIVYDTLLDEGVLALAPPRCEKVCVGKRAGAHSMKQEEINDLLVACGKKYPLTVRLKGGDPFVFGRGGEELAALSEAGISCSVVPGVTSAVAAAELAGIPVTHRGVARAFTVVTAHTVQGVPDVGKFAGTEGTLVFLMAKAACSQIAKGLIAGGRSPRTPAAASATDALPEPIRWTSATMTSPDCCRSAWPRPAPAVPLIRFPAGSPRPRPPVSSGGFLPSAPLRIPPRSRGGGSPSS